ncbi:Sir2 family NAD-dependent protein deacetylase [Paenibacillus sp. sgz302251]|uniref:Sir2 family NAD-dependent protein deacetylase n=1 Tax=Paenibacillus sp. sgz302251 TaxID=3414493 RepID=UPI003C7B238E
MSPIAAIMCWRSWKQQGKLKAVITQNVDDLHRKASSKNVIELHGNIKHLYCTLCKDKYNDSVYLLNSPYCRCGRFIRPDVVLFGEALPEEAVEKAFVEIERADLLIVSGFSFGQYSFEYRQLVSIRTL